MAEDLHDVTLRLPADLWVEIAAMAASEPPRSPNDLIVQLVASAWRRPRRAGVLERLAQHRADMGPQEDSAPFIRLLREGHREG